MGAAASHRPPSSRHEFHVALSASNSQFSKILTSKSKSKLQIKIPMNHSIDTYSLTKRIISKYKLNSGNTTETQTKMKIISPSLHNHSCRSTLNKPDHSTYSKISLQVFPQKTMQQTNFNTCKQPNYQKNKMKTFPPTTRTLLLSSSN